MSARDVDTVSAGDLEILTAVANRIPGKQANELLALIASWQQGARRSPRHPYAADVVFTSEQGSHRGSAKDLSSSGIFISGSGSFAVGDQVSILFSDAALPVAARIAGTVVRSSEQGVGIRFNYEQSTDAELIDALIRA